MNLISLFDLLIGTSFLLGLFLSFKVNRYLKTNYSEKFDIKKLFIPKHQEDKRYISFINWLRILTMIMIVSIWGKVIFFAMNR